MLGILLVNKDVGMSSHDVVDRVRRRFGTRRVGHAGTLDPLASGLLVVAVGPATRFLQYLPLEPKVYTAELHFGNATSSYDAEGEATHSGPVPENLGAALESVLPTYRGLIEQLPPMHSAVKLNGKPLYTYARKGEEVERRPRTVHIGILEIERLGDAFATLRVECSGGTYVRTLAHDIGMALGCGAYLTGLVRNGVGRFALENARPVDETGPDDLIPLRDALEPMPTLRLDEENSEFAQDGRTLQLPTDSGITGTLVSLLNSRGGILGIGRIEGSDIHPECVLPREATAGI